MSNDGHVTDVGRLVHQTTDLLNGEAVERVDISNLIKICMVGMKAPSALDEFDLLDHLGGLLLKLALEAREV